MFHNSSLTEYRTCTATEKYCNMFPKCFTLEVYCENVPKGVKLTNVNSKWWTSSPRGFGYPQASPFLQWHNMKGRQRGLRAFDILNMERIKRGDARWLFAYAAEGKDKNAKIKLNATIFLMAYIDAFYLVKTKYGDFFQLALRNQNKIFTNSFIQIFIFAAYDTFWNYSTNVFLWRYRSAKNCRIVLRCKPCYSSNRQNDLRILRKLKVNKKSVVAPSF